MCYVGLIGGTAQVEDEEKMEKEQPDSLATVAVVSDKIPQTHSHYAPSEVYSTTEPPPVSLVLRDSRWSIYKKCVDYD